jgi:hypothetical protein
MAAACALVIPVLLTGIMNSWPTRCVSVMALNALVTQAAGCGAAGLVVVAVGECVAVVVGEAVGGLVTVVVGVVGAAGVVVVDDPPPPPPQAATASSRPRPSAPRLARAG